MDHFREQLRVTPSVVGSPPVFAFSTGNGSAKGRQLRRDPRVALTFYWSSLARFARVRGVAGRATPEESAADFRARPLAARAIALADRQSDRLVDGAERDRLVSQNLARLRQDPGLVSAEWTLWQVHPTAIEFWQGAADRNHLRRRYRRCDEGWGQHRLWA